jgi:peptide/nickel transport system substrate-binding protein
MRPSLVTLVGVLCLGTVDAVVSSALARTLNWARASDAATLDPHAADDNASQTLAQQIYEPLLQRDYQGKLLPALAESWTLTGNATIWEFRLRQGVKFHDGSPFTADDVVFSLNRARQIQSPFRTELQTIEAVSKADTHVVRIRTTSPTPLLPGSLTHVLMVSKSWIERHGVRRVPAPEARSTAHTFANAVGTGPFMLTDRQAGSRTLMRRNEDYWGLGQAPIEITELVYRSIPDAAERVKSLVSGDVDFVQDVPPQDVQKLQINKAITVAVGPQNLSIFLGLNVTPTARAAAGVEGNAANPLASKRVREAISIAINRSAIQKQVTFAQSIPTGSLVPPSVTGYNRQLDRIPPYDLAKAKSLLTEAGHPSGFMVRLDCPNGLYVRDAQVCRAIAEQLGKIGIKIELRLRAPQEHLALIRRRPPDTDFYLLGLDVPTFDSEHVFTTLFHTPSAVAGQLNATGYSNPRVDQLAENLGRETDFIARNETISQIWPIVKEELAYVPLHIQTVSYAMKNDVAIPVDIENLPKLKTAKFRMTQ